MMSMSLKTSLEEGRKARAEAVPLFISKFGDVDAVTPCRSNKRVAQKTGNGHGADPTWNWGNGTGNDAGAGKVDITCQAGLSSAIVCRLNPVDANIDDCSAGLYVIGSDHIGSANSGHQNICLPADCGKVTAARMGNGHCAI